jgi:hypothetical protein
VGSADTLLDTAHHAIRFRVSVLIGMASVIMFVVACSPSQPAVSAATTTTAPTVPAAESPSTTQGSTTSGASEIATAEDEPIYGYGDYSAYAYTDVPWEVVTAAMVACLQDQGWPVEQIGNTGVSFQAVPVDQNRAAQIDQTRCEAGLNLPEYGAPSALDIEGVYSFWVDVLKPCYEAVGFSIADPPSLETFVESYPAVDWAPWRFLTGSSPELEQRCSSDPYDHDLAGDG